MTENKRNNRETCPVCGFRARYPEHLLCPGCNRQYHQMIETAQERDQKIICTRFQYAEAKGIVTLARLKGEFAVAQRQEQEKQQSCWNKAHRDVREELWKTEMDKMVLYQGEEEEVLQAGIPREDYNKKVGERFNELWNANARSKQLSRKVYGLRKAVASLETFLKSLEKETKQTESIAVA